jgi:hypothetical protein
MDESTPSRNPVSKEGLSRQVGGKRGHGCPRDPCVCIPPGIGTPRSSRASSPPARHRGPSRPSRLPTCSQGHVRIRESAVAHSRGGARVAGSFPPWGRTSAKTRKRPLEATTQLTAVPARHGEAIGCPSHISTKLALSHWHLPRVYRVNQSETNRGSKLRHTSAASTVTRPSAATACAAGAAPPASVV